METSPKLIDLFTNRLFLRPMNSNDSQIVVRWRNSLHVSFASDFSKGRKISIKEHLDWFNNTRSNRIDYIINVLKTNQPIGSIGISILDTNDNKTVGELNKYIGEQDALGKGYASEALEKWIDYLFNFIKLDSIVSKTRLNNMPNIRVNEKNGFEKIENCSYFDLESKEWAYMELSKEKWQSNI
tara:strand:- start:259 stop:810 length:552 start_codon:yes stop_codon:yes gene_type:complete